MFFLKSKDEEFNAFKAYLTWAERQTNTKLKCKRTDWGGEFLSNEQKQYLKENGIEHQMSMPDSPQQNGWAERFQQTIVSGAEAMWHHAGLSNGFWIHAVKVKIHTYNVTPIKRAGYKTPTELFRVGKTWYLASTGLWLPSLGTCFEKEKDQTWAKEPRNDLCQLWTGIQGIPVLGCSQLTLQNFLWCEIWWILTPCTSKVTGTARASTIEWPPISWKVESRWLRQRLRFSHPRSTPTRPNQPRAAYTSTSATNLTSGGSRLALPDMGTAPTPWYSLCPRDDSGHVIKTLRTTENESLSHIMIHMFQDVPNSFWEAISSPGVDKWWQASEDKFEGPRPKDCKMIKCRWIYVLKSDGQYKAKLVTKGYTQVHGIDYEETLVQ